MTIDADATNEIPAVEPVEEAEAETENVCIHGDVDDNANISSSKIEVEANNSSANWSKNRRATITRIMNAKKLKDRIPLGENIYSLMVVSPIYSWPFLFSVLVILGKLTILGILLSDINFRDLQEEDIKVSVVKFCLIPVAVAMQEDMIDSFFFLANAIYCPSIMEHSPVATKHRLVFSYVVRIFDGVLSLFCNFFIMLITATTKDVFLNFAALQFLYSIDDVFYELVIQGFFGDSMESLSKVCKDITLSRRPGTNNEKILGIRISSMDTILFCVSCLICYIIYAVLTVAKYDEEFGDRMFDTPAPTMSMIPSMAPTAASFSPVSISNITNGL